MRVDTTPGKQRVTIGPPGGPTETMPSSFKIAITDMDPYDIEISVEWTPSEGKFTARQEVFTAHPDGESVTVGRIGRVSVREAVRTDLEVVALGSGGWPGLVPKHSDEDPVAVDALVYLLAVALDSPKPSATVALARGLAPSSGPKRVAEARKRGLIPETEPGKVSAVR